MSRLRLVYSAPPGPALPAMGAADAACIEAYRREQAYLHRALRRLGVAPADVEDLAHEVFLVLMRGWAKYDQTRALRPYLFGIAYRVARGEQRKRRREQGSNPLAELEDLGPQPDQGLHDRQKRALLLAALARVPIGRRAVVVMHDIDEVPMRDISTALRIPLFTAYSRLRKGRRELRAAIERLWRQRYEEDRP